MGVWVKGTTLEQELAGDGGSREAPGTEDACACLLMAMTLGLRLALGGGQVQKHSPQ